MKELLAIQAELKAPKNQLNKFGNYKYRSAEDVLEALKPLLKKQECVLTITDEVKEVLDILFIEATATFSKDKESITVKAQAGINPNKKGMDISQSFGSSSSYARKYALNGMFLIDDTKDADATNEHEKQTPKAKQRNFTEEADKCNDLKALGDWWKSLSADDKKKATSVKNNRKEGLSKTIEKKDNSIDGLISRMETEEQAQFVSDKLDKMQNDENYVELVNKYNVKVANLNLDESLSRLPF